MDGVQLDGRPVARPSRCRQTDRMKPKTKRRHRRRLTDPDARQLRALDFKRKWETGLATDDIGLIYRCTGQYVRAEIKRLNGEIAQAEAEKQQALAELE